MSVIGRGRLVSVDCGRCGAKVEGLPPGWRTELAWRWHRLVRHGRITRGLSG